MPTPTPPAVGDIWYRATVNSDNTTLRYEEWVVVATTPQGIWVSLRIGASTYHRRWYSLSTRKISRTKEEALQRLIRRTSSWVGHARARLEQAEARYAALTGGRVREAGILSLGRPFAYGVE